MSPGAPATGEERRAVTSVSGETVRPVKRRRRLGPYAILAVLVLGSFALGWLARGLASVPPTEDAVPFPIVIAEDENPYEEEPTDAPAPPVIGEEGTVPPASDDPDPEQEGITSAEADELYASGEFRAAALAYDRVLLIAPADRDALLGRARSLVSAGEGEAGAQAYWRLLDTHPTDVDSALELMGYYRDTGQYRSSIATGNASLEAVPARGDVEYWIGVGYRELGEVERARAWFQAAIADGPRGTDPEAALKAL